LFGNYVYDAGHAIRGGSKLTEKDITNFLFRFFLENETYDIYDEKLRDLFSLCTSEDEFFLIRHAINNLLIISPGRVSSLTSKLVEIIKEEAKKYKSFALVAMAYDDQPDSSQLVLQLIKPQLMGVSNIKFFNTIPNYLKKTNIIDHPNYLLVDDFSGTGDTVLNRIKHIEDNAKSRDSAVNPSVGILVGMEKSLENIGATGVKVDFVYKCTAGISGHFFGSKRQKYLDCMKRLEEELLPEIESIPLPSLGHGEAEALFCVSNWNAPNSNFPILWWPKDKSSNDRNTVMTRYEL
jgi:hypothetical protein